MQLFVNLLPPEDCGGFLCWREMRAHEVFVDLDQLGVKVVATVGICLRLNLSPAPAAVILRHRGAKSISGSPLARARGKRGQNDPRLKRVTLALARGGDSFAQNCAKSISSLAPARAGEYSPNSAKTPRRRVQGEVKARLMAGLRDHLRGSFTPSGL